MTEPFPTSPPARHGPRYLAGAALCALASNVALIGANAAGMPNLVGVLIAWLLGGSIGYLWHQRITFRAPASWSGFVQMISGSFIAIPIAWGVIALLQDGLGWSMWFAAPTATLVMLAYNYLNARLAILRRDPPRKDS